MTLSAGSTGKEAQSDAGNTASRQDLRSYYALGSRGSVGAYSALGQARPVVELNLLKVADSTIEPVTDEGTESEQIAVLLGADRDEMIRVY